MAPNASVGIAVSDGHGSVDELLRDADAQLDRLRELGCRYGQGLLWGEPVPVDELVLPLPGPMAAGRS